MSTCSCRSSAQNTYHTLNKGVGGGQHLCYYSRRPVMIMHLTLQPKAWLPDIALHEHSQIHSFMSANSSFIQITQARLPTRLQFLCIQFGLFHACSEALQHQPPLLSRACRFASTHSGRSHHVSLSINDDGDAVGPHAALLLTLPQDFDGGSWM